MYMYTLPYRIGIVSRALSTVVFHVVLYFIAVFSSSVVSPVSSHSCLTYVFLGRPIFVVPWFGVHNKTNFTNSSSLR